jgi:hypothetical protein
MALVIGILLFSGCTNPFDSKPEEARGNFGRVEVQVGSAARTLQPVLAFSKYEIAFSGPTGASHDTVTITTGTSTTVEDLTPGAWTITVTAFSGEGDAAKKAAQGSVAVTVTAGKTETAVITLLPYTGEGAAKGTLSYTVAYPAGLESGTLVITQDGTAVENGTINILDSTKNPGNLDLAAGQYKMQIRLKDKGELTAGRTEALHIYPGLTTDANYTFTGADFVAFAEVGDVTVAGTAKLDTDGTAVQAEVKISLYNESFTGAIKNDDLSKWITNLPKDLSAKAKDNVSEGGTEITLVMSGTPTAGSTAEIVITIPGEALSSGNALTVRSNAEAKFAIGLPAATAAVGNVALGVEADKPLTGSVTLTLTNETFKVISANADLTTWFTGLPETLTAKAQTAVTAGDNTLTVAINGTPTEVLPSTKLAITIPAAFLSRGEDLAVTPNDNATLTVSENTLAGVYIVGTPNGESQPDYSYIYPSETYVLKYTKAGDYVGPQYILQNEDTSKRLTWEAIVFSDNGDVHRAGRRQTGAGPNTGTYQYQKNDEDIIEFSNGASNISNPPLIVVDGDTVHVVARPTNSTTRYWKITNKTASSATEIPAITVSGVVMSGDYLYIGGALNGKAAYVKYPKNGGSAEEKSLSDQTGQVTAITVSGDSIYLAGMDSSVDDVTQHCYYWKVKISDDSKDKIEVDTTAGSSVAGIAVSGDTVYLAGTKSSKAVYWKASSGTPTSYDLPDGTSGKNIVLDGTDLYITGYNQDYWKVNTVTGSIDPKVPVSDFSIITGIAVR